MSEKLFDKMFRDKLSGLQVPYRPEDWAAMDDLLNTLDAEGLNSEAVEHFDRKAFSKLDKLEEPLSTARWDLMAAQLAADPELSNEAEDMDPFDLAVAAKLAGVTVPAQEGDWALMNEKIEADETINTSSSDRELDQEVYEGLSGMEVPYNGKDWSKLRTRLDQNELLDGRIIRNKALELVMLLLVVMAFVQILPEKNSYIPAEREEIEIPVIESNATDIITAEVNTPSEGNSAILESSDPNETREESGLLNETNLTSRTAVNQLASTMTDANQNVKGSTAEGIIAKSTLVDNSSSAETVRILEEENVSAVPATADLVSGEQSAIVPPLRTEGIATLGPLPGEMNMLPVSPIDFEDKEMHLLERPSEEVDNIIPSAGPKWELAIAAGPDFQRIVTPESTDPTYDRYSRMENSFSLGLMLSRNVGEKLRIQSGAQFTDKLDYKPIEVVNIISGNSINGWLADSLYHGSLSILSIPVNVQYDFIQKPGWSLYASLGVGLNILTKKDYSYERVCIDCGNTFPGGGQGGVPVPTTKGLFEGGTFADNHYFSMNAGVGVQRNFTSGFSLFLQPSYSASMFGTAIGPQNDKIHTLSILTGAKIRF